MVSHGLLVEQNRFLMVKQQKHGRTFWNFPGGHVEEGETAEQACIREFAEETGLVVRIQCFVGSIQNKHVYVVNKFAGELRLEHKLLDMAWVSEEEHEKWDSKTLQILDRFKSLGSNL